MGGGGIVPGGTLTQTLPTLSLSLSLSLCNLTRLRGILSLSLSLLCNLQGCVATSLSLSLSLLCNLQGCVASSLSLSLSLSLSFLCHLQGCVASSLSSRSAVVVPPRKVDVILSGVIVTFIQQQVERSSTKASGTSSIDTLGQASPVACVAETKRDGTASTAHRDTGG